MSVRRTLLAALTLAILASLVWWDRLQTETEDLSEFAERTLLGMGLEEFARLTLVNEHGRFALERRDDGWWITDPVEDLADPTVFVLLSNMANAKRRRVLDGVPDDELAVYGLEEPRIRATFQADDGREVTLLIGDDSPTVNQTFATTDGTGEIFTVGGHVPANLDRGLAQLRDRRLFRDMEAPVLITAIVVTAEGAVTRVEYDEADGSLWIAGEPRRRADISVYGALIEGVSEMRAESFAPDIADGAAGLDPPITEVALHTSGGQTIGLDVGLPADLRSRSFYARARGRSDVVTISPRDFGLIPRRWTNWLDRDLMRLAPEEVGGFTLTVRGRVQDMNLSFERGEDGLWRPLRQDERVDPMAVEELLNVMARLTADGVETAEMTDPAAYGLDTPWFIFVWHSLDGEVTERLDHGRSSGQAGQAFVRIGAEDAADIVYLAPTQLEEVLTLRARLFDRRIVTADLSQTATILYTLGSLTTRIELRDGAWIRTGEGSEPQMASANAVGEALRTLGAVEFDRTVGIGLAQTLRPAFDGAPWAITLLDAAGGTLAEVRASEIPSRGERDEPIHVLIGGERICELSERDDLILVQNAMTAVLVR